MEGRFGRLVIYDRVLEKIYHSLVHSHRTGKEAGSQVVLSYFPKLGFLLTADILCIETAGVKAASEGGIDWAGDISLEDYPLPFVGGIRYRRC
jgi:hypothetical protein